MLLTLRNASWLVVVGLVLGWAQSAKTQNAFSSQGNEYAIAERLAGDQTHPQLAVNPSGGFLVWQDNVTDGDGLGISALRLDYSFSATLSPFRVNEIGVGDQENPQVALLKNGGTVFVWQGGSQGYQKIYARFLTSTNTFATGDILVNTYQGNQQINPMVACLSNGNVIVVWSSFEQDGSMQGVFARLFSPDGQKLGEEFQVNQTTALNQRTPAVAALANGGFSVVWISEKVKATMPNGGTQYGVIVLGRLYDNQAKPKAGEFIINTGSNVCANPVITALADNGFAVSWGELILGTVESTGALSPNSWDIFGRAFDGAGLPRGVAQTINTTTFGDQIQPRLAAIGTDIMAVWTSLGQDGSWEGVYGRFLDRQGNPSGDEFRVNTTTLSRQLDPTVASDGLSRFISVWTSFTGGIESFDLFAQRYASAQPLPKAATPIASAISSSRLSVTWQPVQGFQVEHYELFMDASDPISITNFVWEATKLAPISSHNFRLLYQLTDGRRSPMSDLATGTTWGEDLNGDGLPDDWQSLYWGDNSANWPPGNVDSDGDGATNYQEFLAGTDPTDKNSVLRAKLTISDQSYLSWNTQPGFVYQVQVSTNFVTWSNLDAPRFAADTTDSRPVDGAHGVAYYRVIRIR